MLGGYVELVAINYLNRVNACIGVGKIDHKEAQDGRDRDKNAMNAIEIHKKATDHEERVKAEMEGRVNERARQGRNDGERA